MPVQDAYAAEQDAAQEGQRADLGLIDVISKAAEGSAVDFGRAVIRGTSDDQAKLPSAAGQAFVGVTEYTTAWSANASDIHLYEENREMNIVSFGRMWVITEQAVVPGDDVFYRHTSGGGGTVIGRFRKDADTATADQIDGASFETTAGAGALAMIQIRGEVPGVAPLTLSETITDDGAGVVSLLTQISLFDTTDGAQALTLADGFEGQEKTMKMTVDTGDDSVITPDNLHDGADLTFADVNDSCELRFVGGTWLIISNNGVAVA